MILSVGSRPSTNAGVNILLSNVFPCRGGMINANRLTRPLMSESKCSTINRCNCVTSYDGCIATQNLARSRRANTRERGFTHKCSRVFRTYHRKNGCVLIWNHSQVFSADRVIICRMGSPFLYRKKDRKRLRRHAKKEILTAEKFEAEGKPWADVSRRMSELSLKMARTKRRKKSKRKTPT